MKDYQRVNFAQVNDMNQLDNEDAIASRASYIERQLTDGLKQKIENYKKKNVDLFLWKYFINNSTDLLLEVDAIYQKNKKNPVLLFQLEQVLGQVEYLFDHKKCVTNADFQKKLENIKLLATSLSGHDSPNLRYLGLLLMLLAATALVSSVAILSLPSLGAGVGIFVGVVLLISGIHTLQNSYQKSLSLSASNIVDSMAQVGGTLRYYDDSISPMLTTIDSEHIRRALELQLNSGFPAKILKDTLKWAKNRHTLMPTLITSENYNVFFHRVANICYVSLTDGYWLWYQRWSVNQEDQPSSMNRQTTTVQPSTNRSFAWFFWAKPRTCRALTYFEEVVSKKLKKGVESETLKSGINRLVPLGFSSEDLRVALEWAVARHDNSRLLNPTAPESYNDFYERIVDICGVVLEGRVPAAVYR